MAPHADDPAPVQPPAPQLRRPSSPNDSGAPPRAPVATTGRFEHLNKAVVNEADIAAGVTSARQRRHVEQAEEQLARRWADEQVVGQLAEDDFQGTRYRRFENDLATYGIAVMMGWLHSGHAFRVTASRGYNIKPSESELEHFARDHDARDQLATLTVAKALPSFRQRALIGGGWSAVGGASLTTYFMGACAYTLPGVFRGYRTQQRQWTTSASEAHRSVDQQHPVNDPAAIATGNSRVREVLGRASSTNAHILALTLEGYSQEEIAEILGLESARAVEGRLHRWRKSEIDLLRKE